MKKILIIGAGFLQNFVIKKAKEMGYYVLTVDGNPDAIGFINADKYAVIDITDSSKCLEFAKKEKIDGVLTAATDYGVLTASYIAQKLNLPGLDYNVAKLIKNKFRVRKCLFENKVDDTKQAFEIDKTSNLEGLQKQIKFPVMIKPCDGSGSRGASRVDSIEDFFGACETAIDSSLTSKAEIESFVFGKEYGAESLVYDGNIYVFGIIRKWMTSHPYYAELGHAIPNDLDSSIETKAIECVKAAIKCLGINFGSVNMDMIITNSGDIHIIDIGARMGGNMIGCSIIPYGTGIDYMGNMIKNAVGDKIDMVEGNRCAVATKLLAFEEGIVKKLPDFKALEKKYNVEIFHNLKVGKTINKYKTNLDGCGYIVAKAQQVDEAIKTTEEVLNIVKNSIF